MTCVTFRFIDRVSRTENKQGMRFKSAACREGRNPAEESTAKTMPKDEYFLQSRHEKKYYKVASHSYF